MNNKIMLFALFCLPFLSIHALAVSPWDYASGKDHRYGIGGQIYSPTDNIDLNKNTIIGLNAELDLRLNENICTGPRIGIIGRQLYTALTNASYTAIKAAYGGKVYAGDWLYSNWSGYSSFRSTVFPYINAELQYYFANRLSEFLAGSPASFAGPGAYIGLGSEMMFGKNTFGYLEFGYQRTSIKSADSQEFPLDGYLLAGGVRFSL